MTAEISKTPWDSLEEHHGEHLTMLGLAGVSRGWVVNGYLDPELKRRIKSDLHVPLMPGLGDSEEFSEARRDLKQLQGRYGDDGFPIVLPDGRAETGMSARFVLPSDLNKTPEQLRQELEAAKKQTDGDHYREEMLRHAHVAVSGSID